MLKKSLTKKHDEKVMVVAREDLFRDGIWNGLRTENISKYLNIINMRHKFLPRGEVEQDPSWKQVIPYLIFENDGRIFLMRRKANHTDLRLANNYSIGVGGHVNRKDLKDFSDSRSARNKKDIKESKRPASQAKRGEQKTKGDGLMDWAKREFEEEIDYHGKYKTEFLGILNHDANDVGMVHVGLVIKVIGDSNDIAVKDEHKSGELLILDEARRYYKQMETWSQIVYDYLARGGSSGVQKAGVDDFSGILPDWIIERYIRDGIIKITPLPKNWQEAVDQVSMDFHLGTHIKLFRGGTYRYVDTRRGLPEDAMEEVNLQDGDPFILEPGAFAIASTREVLKLPSDVIGRLEGKSSLARLGIIVHSTAARFDPGWNGAPVLELGNLGPKPAILYSGMAICAFTFEKIGAPVKMPYEGSRSDRYSGSKDAVASKIEQHGKEG